MARVTVLLLVVGALLLGAAAENPCLIDSPHCIKKDSLQLKKRDLDSTELRATSLPMQNAEIFGKEGHPVPVFVLVNSKNIILRCMTQKMAVQGIIGQRYTWSGPIGIINKDSEKFILTEEGSLIFYIIHGYDSGRYTCNILYRSEDKHVTKEIHFMIYVFPYTLTCEDLCDNSDCNTSNIRKAYVRMKHFFEKIGSRHSSLTHYINSSLTGVKVDHCKPGYGKNEKNSTICPGCCIACPPGKFSAKFDTTCIPCALGSYNANYGQTACINCPESKMTGEKGSKSKNECQIPYIDVVEDY
uniref:Zona pellucida-binding protein 2-like isoform X2 n=1 Tax=Geotrypetes seraphini TaxID=260995 RepID=A0A6P8Q627_GEOSA|nr:zona pellucida-binding protein 2-like isoform X2 [Geotrypetes seraphini]